VGFLVVVKRCIEASPTDEWRRVWVVSPGPDGRT
jgi:hypothetical protein